MCTECIRKAYKCSRQELLESKSTGSSRRRSNENANAGGSEVPESLECKRGRFSAEVWLEGWGEKGGEGDGEEEKMYFWLPGPTLMGRGEGGVGGEDDGEG